MLANVPSDVDKSEGSLIYDALSPVSQEIALSEIALDEVFNMVFAQNAVDNGYSAQLELRCSEFGLTRKPGTLATCQVSFTGVDTTPIPAGTKVQTPGGLVFETTVPGVIAGGVATVDIQAVEVGASYNVPPSTITQLPVVVSGITGVNNLVKAEGGTDIETDALLFKRFTTQVQTPSTSGNAAHYVQWALSVPGIGAAIVFPLWNGAGTVKVAAIDSTMQPLSAPLLASLSAYIELERPIGATVTYVSASALPISISVNVVRNIAYNQAQILASVTAAITNYLKSIAFNQLYVSYAAIGALIMATPGVTDYSAFTMNSGVVNVIVSSTDVATMDSVVVIAP